MTFHFVESSNLGHKGSLECIDLGIQLQREVNYIKYDEEEARGNEKRTSLNWTLPSSPSSATQGCATSAGMYSWTSDISSERKRLVWVILVRMASLEVEIKKALKTDTEIQAKLRRNETPARPILGVE